MASIVRYEPFALGDRWAGPAYDRFFDRFDRMVQDAFGLASALAVEPGRQGIAANLYQTAESYWVELPLPGVKPEDVEVSVQQNLLTLKAKRQWSAPQNAQTLWQGLTSGELQHSFTLPGEVDADKVEARLEYGVLRLHLPKAEHVRPRQIRIQGDSEQPRTIEAGPNGAPATASAGSAS